MTNRWLRREPDRREQATAVGIALGVAAVAAGVAFYLTRLFLTREEMAPLDDRAGTRALPADKGTERALPTPPGEERSLRMPRR